jgi:hypothetical protein
MMTARFSPPLFRSLPWAIYWTLLLSVSIVSAADYLGPVFPDDTLVDMAVTEPLPLPKRNPLLQRPQNRQVVFDDLDPTGTLIPQSLLYNGDIDLQPQVVRQRQIPPRMAPVIDSDNAIFMNNGEIIRDGIIGEYPYAAYSFVGDACVTGPFPIVFGMGLFDNITLFGESTTFKTGLNGEGGSFGLSEGLNWSAAVTPQGAVTAQYGVRTVQGDMSSRSSLRTQLFMTAGIFKRFDFAPIQGGVAVDWLEDRSPQFGLVNLRQMRGELSYRTLNNLECGFIGAFNVFWDRPVREGKVIGVHDYYLLFVRKHLDRDGGGQVELRCGSPAYGGFMMSALGEAALTDRLAVNGGVTILTPSGGQSGNDKESWSMSLGIVLYFRGGAICRQINPYRPLFDVAGNNSFFPRIMGQ